MVSVDGVVLTEGVELDEARTWPNELVREAVRGMELSRLKDRARHDATLPFTRFLAGHADYTPVHFGARRGDTTWAHQIASAAVQVENRSAQRTGMLPVELSAGGGFIARFSRK